MPLYDYECSSCGSVKEVQHSVSEIGTIKIRCAECDQPMKKMLSVPALIGFDSVGRSIGRKGNDESPAKDAAKSDTSKKDTTSKSGSQKDAKS